MGNKKNSLIYLASPYTHKDEKVQEGRFDSVCEIAARLMSSGRHVFSPIAHGHSIARFGLPGEFEYWKAYCENTLLRCDVVMVVTLPGYEDSVGIKHEIALAEKHKIPVYLVNAHDGFE